MKTKLKDVCPILFKIEPFAKSMLKTILSYFTPSASQSFKKRMIAGHVDLNLKSQWYVKLDQQEIDNLPEIIKSNNHAYEWRWNNNKNVVLLVARFEDLSSSYFKIEWDSNYPSMVISEQRHVNPPKELAINELKKAHKMYGRRIVQFCIDYWGKKVGNGECWSLANEALKSINGCMPSQMRTHGCLVYSTNSADKYADKPRKGDIIQYKSCKFVRKSAVLHIGLPDHTSIIIGFKGEYIKVAEQNIGGVKSVGKGYICLNELIEGEIRIFRPVWNSWVGGDLYPSWD